MYNEALKINSNNSFARNKRERAEFEMSDAFHFSSLAWSTVSTSDIKEKIIQKRSKLEVGDVLKYSDIVFEIKEIFKKGGMGSVYKAYDKKKKEMVVLKSFKEDDSWDRRTWDNLKQEAHTWINLGVHQNIVEAKLVTEFHGKVYIVMEYIDGGDLEDLMKDDKLKIIQSLDYAIQFCNGMEYAYEVSKMVHRDIKPGNILLTKEGTLKITDFGVATTAQNEKFGGLTFPYASPDQLRELMGDQVIVDTRADIYSFGVVLYQMLTGIRPFEAIETHKNAEELKNQVSTEEFEQFISENSKKELIQKHLQVKPRNLIEINDEIPKKLDNLVIRCLEKNPDSRYKNFSCLKEELMRIYKESAGGIYNLPGVESENSNEWYWNNKGLSLQNLKEFDEAIKCFDMAVQINPRFKKAWSNKGLVYLDMNRGEMGLRFVDKALQIDPKDKAVWLNKGTILHSLKRYEDAIICYDKTLEMSPEEISAWSNKGSALSDLKRYEDAIRCFNRALEIDSQNELVWNNKGNALALTGRYQEAIHCLDNALKINPQHDPSWGNKGLVYYFQKRYKKSVECYGKALEVNPKSEEHWISIAAAYWALFDWKKVVHCYDAVLRYNPDNTEVRKLRDTAIRNYRGGF